jgi:tRNA G10  N-methylase Trm11
MRVLKGISIGYAKDTQKIKNKVSADIFTNFIHYNLPIPQILRADIHYPCFRDCEYFDAIICDPPYGHRAFTRSTGMKEEKKVKREARLEKKYKNFKKKDGKSKNHETKTEKMKKDNESELIEIDNSKEHLIVYDKQTKEPFDPYFFSPLKQCSVEQIFENLLFLGNKCLKKNGYLVCLYPTKKSKEEDE